MSPVPAWDQYMAPRMGPALRHAVGMRSEGKS